VIELGMFQYQYNLNHSISNELMLNEKT